VKAVLLAPLKFAATLAFFYVLGGWMVVPPSAILGGFF